MTSAELPHSSRLPDTRWGAFAVHLGISALIFLVLFLLIWLIFFPGALFAVAGGVDGIKIIAGVDLVLGPLLTLIIYNVSKPRRELYRDLSVIGLIQAGALLAGMWIVYQSRPLAVTWVYDHFAAAKKSEFVQADAPLPSGYSGLTTRLYAVELPADDEQAQVAVATSQAAGEPLRLRTDLYQPLPRERAALRELLRGKVDVPDAGCAVVDIVTAFDATQVCFDPERQRFSSVPR